MDPQLLAACVTAAGAKNARDDKFSVKDIARYAIALYGEVMPLVDAYNAKHKTDKPV